LGSRPEKARLLQMSRRGKVNVNKKVFYSTIFSLTKNKLKINTFLKKIIEQNESLRYFAMLQ